LGTGKTPKGTVNSSRGEVPGREPKRLAMRGVRLGPKVEREPGLIQDEQKPDVTTAERTVQLGKKGSWAGVYVENSGGPLQKRPSGVHREAKRVQGPLILKTQYRRGGIRRKRQGSVGPARGISGCGFGLWGGVGGGGWGVGFFFVFCFFWVGVVGGGGWGVVIFWGVGGLGVVFFGVWLGGVGGGFFVGLVFVGVFFVVKRGGLFGGLGGFGGDPFFLWSGVGFLFWGGGCHVGFWSGFFTGGGGVLLGVFGGCFGFLGVWGGWVWGLVFGCGVGVWGVGLVWFWCGFSVGGGRCLGGFLGLLGVGFGFCGVFLLGGVLMGLGVCLVLGGGLFWGFVFWVGF